MSSHLIHFDLESDIRVGLRQLSRFEISITLHSMLTGGHGNLAGQGCSESAVTLKMMSSLQVLPSSSVCPFYSLVMTADKIPVSATRSLDSSHSTHSYYSSTIFHIHNYTVSTPLDSHDSMSYPVLRCKPKKMKKISKPPAPQPAGPKTQSDDTPLYAIISTNILILQLYVHRLSILSPHSYRTHHNPKRKS